MVKRNPNLKKLNPHYLFQEIRSRTEAFLKKNPDEDLINLGIGDTTLPIPSHISGEMEAAAARLGTEKGYSGYGPSEGLLALREKISEHIYQERVSPEEIFISDGAKCDISRLQILFGSQAVVAVQDPTYPVYVDGSVIAGCSGKFDKEERKYDEIVYLPCTPDNQFFPEFEEIPKTDLIYICSPNNPTGSAASKEQLEKLVAHAKNNRSIILFDVAYRNFIRDPDLPRSIYEIEGGDEVAIESGSFSKIAGFTGVRLGWSVVPKKLQYNEGGSVHSDWKRIISTLFNGPSNIAQYGGIASLDEVGREATKKLVQTYMENAVRLTGALEEKGFKVYGGINAPYVWVEFPGKKSWELFDDLLKKCKIITTPGAGFGPSGEGFVRFSAFASKEKVERAIENLARL